MEDACLTNAGTGAEKGGIFVVNVFVFLVLGRTWASVFASFVLVICPVVVDALDFGPFLHSFHLEDGR